LGFGTLVADSFDGDLGGEEELGARNWGGADGLAAGTLVAVGCGGVDLFSTV
jgi:hypothetical protein